MGPTLCCEYCKHSKIRFKFGYLNMRSVLVMAWNYRISNRPDYFELSGYVTLLHLYHRSYLSSSIRAWKLGSDLYGVVHRYFIIQTVNPPGTGGQVLGS